jgi:hypothetical protein
MINHLIHIEKQRAVLKKKKIKKFGGNKNWVIFAVPK